MHEKFSGMQTDHLSENLCNEYSCFLVAMPKKVNDSLGSRRTGIIAPLEDSAQIYGNAKIHGESEELLTISWDLKIHGGDWTDTPYYRVGALWLINISSPDTVRIGCRDYTFERWKKNYKAILYAYRREQIDEIGVKECVEVYNAICRKYLKYEYMVDPTEILDCYRKVKVKSLLPLQRT